MEKAAKERLIVDPESGSVVGTLGEGDRVIHRREALSSVSDTIDWKMEEFLKGGTRELASWMNDLNKNERCFLFSVMPYVGYTDCCLKKKNGDCLGSEELVQITGLRRATLYETIDSLIKKDILYRGKNSRERQYFVNPWFFVRGSRVNKVLQTMFKNYRIRVLGGLPFKDFAGFSR